MAHIRAVLLLALLCSQGASAGRAYAPASWGYQLDQLSPVVIAAAPYELMVIDYSRDGCEVGAFTRSEVAAMQRMPGGGKRKLLAYLSIGEAEDYRFYWRPEWKQRPPAWLGEENPGWPGNYKVHYWEPGWQQTLFGHPGAYLDRIIDAGFDGVYLDIIDAFEYYQDSHPQAPAQMARLVAELARYARERNPGFLVLGQNGETLVDDPTYLGAIDGIAKEDLYYGMEIEGEANAPDEIEFSLRYLRRAREAGKILLLVTYIRDPERIAQVTAAGEKEGFRVYAGVRELDRLVVPGAAGADRESASDTQTPGDFYASTTPRGTLKTQFSLTRSRERSRYEERDEFGQLVYSERSKTRQWDLGLQVKYGVTDYFDLGFRLPLTRASESTKASSEDEMESWKTTSRGVGNPSLLAGLGGNWNRGNGNALLEIEFGMPLSEKDKLFSSGADFRLALNLEHYWDRVGLLSVIARNWSAEEDFNGWSASTDYQLGIGAELDPRLFASLLAGETDHTANAEFSLEYLVDAHRSLELNLTGDLEGDRKARGAMVAVNVWLE